MAGMSQNRGPWLKTDPFLFLPTQSCSVKSFVHMPGHPNWNVHTLSALLPKCKVKLLVYPLKIRVYIPMTKSAIAMER